jgi:hypothetical protein
MAGSSNIRAGAAYVELYVKNNRFVRGLNQASARLRQFGAGMMRIGARIAAAGAAIVGPILLAAKAFAKAGDTLDKMSARTGASVKFLSALGYAAELGGSSLADMEKGIRTLQGAAYDAADGLQTYVRAFDDLGVSVKDSNGNLKETEQLFKDTIAALSREENATKKAALAKKLFGRAGTALLPMLRAGEKGFNAAMEEAERLGYVLSEKDATAAAELTDALARVKMSLHAVWIRVGSAVADMITKLANRMAEMSTTVIDFVKRNQPLIASLFKIGAAVVALGVTISVVGAGIFGLGLTLGAIGAIITGVASTIGLIGSALAFLLTPIGLVAAAVVGLGGYFLYASGAGEKAIGGLAKVFGRLKDDALKAFGGIRDAMAAGDMQLAAEVLWKALKVKWQEGINWLHEKWVGFKDVFGSVWTEAVYGLATAFANVTAQLEKIWVEFTGWFVDKWKGAEKSLAKGIGLAIAQMQGLNPAEVLGDINRQYDQQDKDRAKRQKDRLQQIEEQRAGTVGILDEEREKAHVERQKKHDAELAASREKLNQAEQEYNKTLEEAAKAKDVAAQVQAEFERLFGGATKPGGLAGEATAAATKVTGTFSAAAAQRLGMGGNAQERTATATEEIVKNTMELRRARRLRWI